jgi:FKBP-type peptidyl-prolyl cis-trans isomerase
MASALIVSCTQPMGSKKDVVLNTELDSVSYAIGVDIGNNLKKNYGIDSLSPDAIAKGFSDVFAGAQTKIEEADANKFVMNYFNKLRDKKAATNLKAAEEFLKENGTKEGVQTTASGLQYKVLKEGTGPKPTATDMVKVYYKGTLIDGTPFDSTTNENPAQFRVNGVIKGWTEALQMMPVGSKWMLYIHPDLGYGSRGQGRTIEPNSALIFEIELVDIVNPNKK